MVWRCAALLLVAVLVIANIHQTPSEQRITIIVEHEADDEFLRGLGAVEVVEGVSTAELPMHQAAKLKHMGYVIHRPRTYLPLLDVSTAEIGVPEISLLSGVNAESVDGRGVLIAIIDTGVDYSHPAFKSTNGTSRILYIWDQTIDGKPPAQFGYGYECDGGEISLGTCPQRDTVGHGTVVASIAAGSAYGGWSLRGVAPGAELIVVKSGGPACGGRRWFFDEKQLLDGIAYAVQKSTELNRRLVVVLALGTDIGAHDGSAPLEKALDKWAEQGIFFVVAAGNSANDSRHAEGMLVPETPVTLRWTVPSETTSVSISFVTHHRNRFNVGISTPTGTKIDIPFNGSKTVEGITAELSETKTGALKEVLVDVSADLLEPGLWSLIIRPVEIADGKWHAWIQSDTCDYESESFVPSLEYQITPASTVTIPGTAKKVLTVGAYTTKNRWTADGQTWSVAGEPGQIEFYSGRGPTMDGRVKPDITAPGGIIVAARSKDMPGQSFSPGPEYTVGRGTSMATSHAAGVAAIVLQLAPNITVDQAMEIIKRNARIDAFTGEISFQGSNLWGWGKINAAVASVFELEVIGDVSKARPALYLNGSLTKIPTPPGMTKVVVLKKTNTNITMFSTVGNDETRYIVEPRTVMASEAVDRAVFKVTALHRVVVVHPNGTTLSSTWEKEGETLDLVRRAAELGVDAAVVGYVDESGTRYQRTLVDVSRPMRIVLILEQKNLIIPVLGISATITLSTVLVFLFLRFRRKAPGQKMENQAVVDYTSSRDVNI